MPQSERSGSTQEPRKKDEDTRPESDESTVSEPGGFKNDPDDAANPNEAIERHRRKLRP